MRRRARAAKKYAAFLASESVIKQIPRLLGPGLNKAGKFPTLVTHNDKLEEKARRPPTRAGPPPCPSTPAPARAARAVCDEPGGEAAVLVMTDLAVHSTSVPGVTAGKHTCVLWGRRGTAQRRKGISLSALGETPSHCLGSMRAACRPRRVQSSCAALGAAPACRLHAAVRCAGERAQVVHQVPAEEGAVHGRGHRQRRHGGEGDLREHAGAPAAPRAVGGLDAVPAWRSATTGAGRGVAQREAAACRFLHMRVVVGLLAWHRKRPIWACRRLTGSRRAAQMSVNFLVSLLKKNWQNVKCLYIKSSMGKPVRLY